MIEVLQVNKFYYPHIGGVEKVVQQLSEEFLKEPGLDNSVLACHTKREDFAGQIRGVKVTLAGSLRTVLGMPISTTFTKHFSHLANTSDLVDFHMPFPLAAWSLKKLTAPRTRIVVHYHADVVRQKNLRWAYEPAFHRLLERADAVIVSSPNLRSRSEMLRTYQDKTHVIPFMMTLPRVGTVTPDRIRMVKGQLGIPKDMPVVVSIGRFVYYKGLPYLLHAMAGVKETALLLVGSGPMRDELAGIAKQLGIAHRVFWKSGVSDDELADYYAVGDVFAFPSSATTEAYGIVQMEALASGLPVVNTSLPTGVPWVSKDGESGITVPPCDAEALRNALNDILTKPGLREKFKEGALKRAEEFAPSRVVNATLKLYRGLLSS